MSKTQEKKETTEEKTGKISEILETKDTTEKPIEAAAVVTKKRDKKAILKAKIAAMREKDSEKVRGVFRNHETPGAPLSFSFRVYKEDNVESYNLEDESIYSLPYGVVKHLNNDCWYPVHSHTLNEDGKAAISVGRKVRRFSFSPLDFIDDRDFNNKDKEIIIARPLG